AILSNTDRDYIDASLAAIGVPFDLVIVAGEIGSYKPAHGHWHAFEQAVGRLPDVHVAASHFHDVVPATALGLKTIWINRLGEELEPEPTRELPNLSGLAEALDELAPAAP
ncbi:MAG: putative hydrolase of the superfamily, partial [Gaiellaceae bacterium]|nr:putative hydrolase of the superfamily [Gaiellaceae bacterium]